MEKEMTQEEIEQQVCLIQMHEDGFPMADLFVGYTIDEFYEYEPTPDAYLTLPKGRTLEEVSEKAAEVWPLAKIVFAQPDEDYEDDE